MAGSIKDALEKSGLVTPKVEPKQDHTKWRQEISEERVPYIPFDAPARTKPKETPKPKR